MEPGDLVRRKNTDWLALLLEVDGAFVQIMRLHDGDIDGCSASLMEVVTEDDKLCSFVADQKKK